MNVKQVFQIWITPQFAWKATIFNIKAYSSIQATKLEKSHHISPQQSYIKIGKINEI